MSLMPNLPASARGRKNARVDASEAADPAVSTATLAEACDFFEASASAIEALVFAGLLQGTIHDGEITSVQMHHAQTLTDLADAYYENPGPLRTADDFERYRKISRILLRRPTVRIPPSVVDDAFAYMNRNDLKPTRLTFTSLIGGPAQVTDKLFVAELEGRGLIGSNLAARRHPYKPGTNVEPLVLARVHPIIQSVPGTSLDPNARGIAKPPHPRYFNALHLISERSILNTLTVIVYAYEQQGLSKYQLMKALTAARRLCSFAQGRDLTDPIQLLAVMEDALGPAWKRGGDVGYSRLETVYRYFWLVDKYTLLLADLARTGRALEFQAFKPVLPIGHAALRRSIERAVGGLKGRYQANRHRRIQKILDNPVQFQLVGRLRAKEHETILDAVDAEIDAILATGRKLSAPVALTVPYETHLSNEGFRTCNQALHLEIWTYDMVHTAVAKARARRQPVPPRRAPKRVPLTHGRAEFAIRYIGTTPATPGGPVQLPVVVEVALGHICDQSVRLSAAELRAQEEARRKHHFDTEVPSGRWGLGHFPAPEGNVARAASRILGMTLLPLREITLALSLAEAALRVQLDCGGRHHEASQLRLGKGEVSDRFDEDLKTTIWSFQAYPKGRSTPQEYHILDATMMRVLDVCERLVAYYGLTEIPITKGDFCQRSKNLSPGRHAFFTPTSVVRNQLLTFFMKLLYLGWAEVRPHDVRHLFNSLARHGRVPRADRMQIMGHDNAAVNDAYGKNTPAQQATQDAKHACFLLERELNLLDELRSSDSAEVRRLTYELRLNKTLLEFHVKERDLQQIKIVEEKISELALELAQATATESNPAGDRR